MNIEPMSLALPGTDLNLTRLKVPATATPAPILPFTIIITVHTTAGSIAKVITKLLVYFVLKAYINAKKIPINIDTPMQIMNPLTSSVSLLESSTD